MGMGRSSAGGTGRAAARTCEAVPSSRSSLRRPSRFAPCGAFRAVFDGDAEGGELVADLVGELELLGGAEVAAGLEEEVDEGGGGEVGGGRLGVELQAEHAGELAERGAGGGGRGAVAALTLSVRLAGQVEDRCHRARGVEVVVHRLDERLTGAIG